MARRSGGGGGRVTPKGGRGPVDVTYKGSLFDGSLARDVGRWCDGIEDELGELAVKAVRARLDVVLVNPTGYYRSKVTSERRGSEVHVHDSRVVYGPWLEGVGSRNATTRFKGYRTFRLIMGEIQAQSTTFATAIRSKYVDF